MPNIQDVISDAARSGGVDPAFALAVADRESSFNPYAHASKTIQGLYQMSAPLRYQYGIGNSFDPQTQASGWMRFYHDVKSQMGKSLGRDPTDAEVYMGHYWGPGRAARMINAPADTPVASIFTPYERALNPEFDRAGTTGRLVDRVGSDVNRRIAKFGGSGSGALDFASMGERADQPDFSGEAEGERIADAEQSPSGGGENAPTDFSQAGTASA